MGKSNLAHLLQKIVMDMEPKEKPGSSNISSNENMTDSKCPTKVDTQIADHSKVSVVRKSKKGAHGNSMRSRSTQDRNAAGEALKIDRPEVRTADNRFRDISKTKVQAIRDASKGAPSILHIPFDSRRSLSARSRNATGSALETERPEVKTVDNRFGDISKTKFKRFERHPN